jgi:hypothetical protein
MPKRERALFPAKVPVWNIRGLIIGLGGVTGTVEALLAKGFLSPGVNTVQGWARRNRVPGDWSPALFAAAQDNKVIEGPMDALLRDLHVEPKRARK